MNWIYWLMWISGGIFGGTVVALWLLGIIQAWGEMFDWFLFKELPRLKDAHIPSRTKKENKAR